MLDFVHAFQKVGKGISYTSINLKKQNNEIQRNNCADERTKGRRADYERADTKYTTNKRRRNQTMQNCQQLLITMQGGTKVKIEENIQSANDTTPSEVQFPQLFLNPEKGRKLDIIRIINAVAELGFILDTNGRKAQKKDIFQAAGILLHTDFSNFNSDLSGSLADGSSMKKHLKIFEELTEMMKTIFNSR